MLEEVDHTLKLGVDADEGSCIRMTHAFTVLGVVVVCVCVCVAGGWGVLMTPYY